MKRIIIFIIIVCVLTILIISSVNFDEYYLILKGTEKEIKISTNGNDTFIISYTHSVALTKVYEYYRISDNKIVLYKMEFFDQCAGLPTETIDEEEFIMENGKFIITKMDREFEYINYRVNSKYEFKLDIKDDEVNLSNVFGDDLVILSLRRR